MPCQYKREPLSDDEVNRLTNACETFDEKLIIWTLSVCRQIKRLVNVNSEMTLPIGSND
jgi:hypothetical protein